MAVRMIAKEFGLNTVNKIQDFYKVERGEGQTQSVLIGVQGDGAKYGLGVRLNKGKIEVVGDDYGQAISRESFGKRVEQAYKAVSYQVALQKQSYQASVAYNQQQKRYVVVGQRA